MIVNKLVEYNENNNFYYAIILIFLATSGFPSFMVFRPFICLLIPILYFHVKKRHIYIPKQVYGIYIFTFIFCFIHLLLGHFTFIGAISFFLDIITYSLSVLVIGFAFAKSFIGVMKFLSYVAVLFWFFIVIFPSIYPYLVMFGHFLPQFISDSWEENTTNLGVSLYLYFLPTNAGTYLNGFFRNCGPFFEPGLFASYLTIAIILNLSFTKSLFDKKNSILVIALLTTFSSAGYVSFALIVFYVTLFSKNTFVKVLYLLAILILWQPIMNLDFMSDKISKNMSQSSDRTDSRFGAILYHSEKVVESPIIGFAGGKLPMTNMDYSLGNLASERVLSPNGLSLVFVFWGIPLAIVFYICLFKSLRYLICVRKGRLEILCMYFIILSAAFSQTITNGPIILIFVLFSLIKSKEDEKIKSRSNPYLQFPV